MASTEPNNSVAFKGAVNNSKTEGELVSIAQALKINNSGTKSDLIPCITAYLNENSAILSENSRFQELYASSGSQ